MPRMTYCSCPFPVFRPGLDVDNRERMKCERCHRYEDPEEAAENGRPVSARVALSEYFDDQLRRQKG